MNLDNNQHAEPNHHSLIAAAGAWLERIDPGTHRRIKGLRLVTAYGIAAMLGTLQAISHGLPSGASLSSLAGSMALWASVSEAQTTRAASSRDLTLLCAAAVLGAASMIILTPLLSGAGRPGPELTLAAGAFLVGYLRRFGILGAGIGSQIFIGQLLAFGAKLLPADLGMVCVAGGHRGCRGDRAADIEWTRRAAGFVTCDPFRCHGGRRRSTPGNHHGVAGSRRSLGHHCVERRFQPCGIGLGHHGMHVCHCQFRSRHHKAGTSQNCWHCDRRSTWPCMPTDRSTCR